jgi:hypothetical protein
LLSLLACAFLMSPLCARVWFLLPSPGKTIGKVIAGEVFNPPALVTEAYEAPSGGGAGAGTKKGLGGLMSFLGKSAPEGGDVTVTMSPVCCDVITLLCHGVNDRRAVEVCGGTRLRFGHSFSRLRVAL